MERVYERRLIVRTRVPSITLVVHNASTRDFTPSSPWQKSRGIELTEHHADLRFPLRLAEKDRPIFQAAIACGATHLLTGNLKDFGAFMNQPEKTFGVLVQTVADFLDSLLDRERAT